MVCLFEKYSDILGKEKTGMHQYRFLDTSIVDYIMTIVLSCFTTYIFEIPLVLTTVFWFIVSIFMHMLFCVKTGSLKFIGYNF
jgi:hypothetical protein